MKFTKSFTSLILSVLFIGCFNIYSFANSWVWTSENIPYMFLPHTIILATLIECAIIILIAKPKNTLISAFTILVCNVLSFTAYYIYVFIRDANVSFWSVWGYNANPIYFVLTIFFEIPIVFYLLSKDVDKPKLLIAIVSANTITTIMSLIADHLLCPHISF